MALSENPGLHEYYPKPREKQESRSLRHYERLLELNAGCGNERIFFLK